MIEESIVKKLVFFILLIFSFILNVIHWSGIEQTIWKALARVVYARLALRPLFFPCNAKQTKQRLLLWVWKISRRNSYRKINRIRIEIRKNTIKTRNPQPKTINRKSWRQQTNFTRKVSVLHKRTPKLQRLSLFQANSRFSYLFKHSYQKHLIY